MLNAIEADPSLVSSLLDTFLENPDSLLSGEISAVISQTGLPEVQSAVLDMGLDQSQSYNHEDRAAALLVIANMDSIEGETRDRLLDSYSQELNSEILQFSLIAL